jgi:hypothetical protein
LSKSEKSGKIEKIKGKSRITKKMRKIRENQKKSNKSKIGENGREKKEHKGPRPWCTREEHRGRRPRHTGEEHRGRRPRHTEGNTGAEGPGTAPLYLFGRHFEFALKLNFSYLKAKRLDLAPDCLPKRRKRQIFGWGKGERVFSLVFQRGYTGAEGLNARALFSTGSRMPSLVVDN